MRKLYLLSIALLLLVYTCKSAPSDKIINQNENDDDVILMKCEKCEDCEGSNLEASDDSKKSETTKCKSCGIGFDDQRKVMKGCTEVLQEQKKLKLIYNCSNTDNCNNITKNKCYKCSSEEDVNCVDVTSSTKTEYCSNLSTKCFTKIDKEGYTVRGCKSNDDTECNSESCFECAEFNCNKKIKKDDHRQCYHCSGKDCLAVNEKQKRYCSKYMKNDECYTDVLTEYDANRGCLSDLNDNQKSDNILKCKPDNCNEKKAIESVIQCVECKENDGKDCLRPENSNDTKKCEIDSSNLRKCTVKKLLNHKDKNKKQCYTFYKNGEIERGCEEVDINNHDKEYCINADMCNKKCTPLMCYTCDSKKDINCKNDIKKLKASDCEKDTCYSCTDKDGNIFRGCGKNEDENMTCNQCSSHNKCNTDNPEKPPPADNLMCYSCDSKDDPNCAQVNNLSKIKTVKCENTCAIKIKDGNTLRGCLSETLSCDSKKENCITCNMTLCNGEVFPEKRLKCHHCDGKNKICNEEQKSENLLPCKNYNSTDSCYAYASTSNNETKMYRGCYSDPEFSLCKEAGTKMCKTCNDTKGCNSFPLQTKAKLSCIKCEKKDTACAWGHNDNKKINCTGEHFYYLEESCFVKKFDKNEVQRGCSLENADVCKEGSANCTLCVKDGCNNENVITQSCLQCDSKIPDETKKCTSAKDIKATTCPGIIPFEYRGCYTKREGKDVIRNCAIKLGKNFENCKNEKDKKKCEICEKDGCNNKSNADNPEKPPPADNLMCYSCDSKDDPNCAQVNNLSKIKTVKCENACAIKIKDGNTLRGCLSETLSCDSKKENCITCNMTLCNGEVFPEKRLKCHHCDGKNKICNEEQKSENLLPCKNYNSTDSCYAYASTSNNETKMYRGCYSDPEFSLCKEAGTKMCKTCNDTKGCNSFPLQTKAKLSCIKCEKKDTACAWGHNDNKKINCTGEHFYYLEESCFVKKFDKNEVQRGCSLENADVCKEGVPNCTFCLKDGCNNENVITQSCLQCDSKIPDETKKCTSAKDIKATTCPGIIPFEYRGCYIKREGKDVIRNCAVKLGENFENCKNEKDKNKCEICEKDGCNSGNMFSVASITVLVSVMIHIFH